MAIIRLAPLIGGISGNLGGASFTTGRAGPVARQRIRQRTSNQIEQQQTRVRLRELRNTWRTLTDDQRTLWDHFAAQIPRFNRLGIDVRITGFQLFVKHNMFAWNVPGTAHFPIITELIAYDKPKGRIFTSFNVTSGGAKNVTYDTNISGSAIDAIMYGARTFSTAVRSSWFHFKAVDINVFTFNPITVTGWDDVIGDPQPGEQCWIKIWQRSILRVVGPPQILSATAQ